MDKDFMKIYKNVLIHKQKSITYHQLATNNLFHVLKKMNTLNKEDVRAVKVITERIDTTLRDMQNLQIRKMDLKYRTHGPSESLFNN